MLRTILVIALLFPLSFASASTDACPPEGEPVLVDAGGVYVTDAPAVFQESNGRAGLQSSAGSCEDGNGRTISWDADARLI